jgi:hypothetical protein
MKKFILEHIPTLYYGIIIGVLIEHFHFEVAGVIIAVVLYISCLLVSLIGNRKPKEEKKQS